MNLSIICAVSDISGTRMIAFRRLASTFSVALIYISVLPLPVTPCIRNLSCCPLSTAAPISVSASFCCLVSCATSDSTPRLPANGSFLSPFLSLLPAGVKHFIASIYLQRYRCLIHSAVRTISGVSETSGSTLSTYLSFAPRPSGTLSETAAT